MTSTYRFLVIVNYFTTFLKQLVQKQLPCFYFHILRVIISNRENGMHHSWRLSEKTIQVENEAEFKQQLIVS